MPAMSTTLNSRDLSDKSLATRTNDFVKLCLDHSALKFGEFTLKSGRVSPYFFNVGEFYQADALAELAKHYAELIDENVKGDITLFGPAYKGIPLAVATAMALHRYHDRDVACAFNRKETKTHGEGGDLIGAPLVGDVVIIDDVITAGTAVSESMNIINEADDANVVAVIIALDREETDDDGLSVVEKVKRMHGVEVHARITLLDLIVHLQTESTAESEQHVAELFNYRARYGVRERNGDGYTNGNGYVNGNGSANVSFVAKAMAIVKTMAMAIMGMAKW